LSGVVISVTIVSWLKFIILTDGERSTFLGPRPGALIYVKLEFWRDHYVQFDEFPYPQTIDKCIVQGRFVGFKFQNTVPYWHLDFAAFTEKIWVKEAFFNTDVWSGTCSSSEYLVDKEHYDELEKNVRVTDEDLERSDDDDIPDENDDDVAVEEEGPRAPALRPRKRSTQAKPRGQQRRQRNSNRVPRHVERANGQRHGH
jgi:hypothetical protein